MAPSVLASLDDHERVLEGDYTDDFLKEAEALGMHVEVVDARTANRFRGAVIALALDHEAGTLKASAASAYGGSSCAY